VTLQQRALGRTGLSVSILGLGGASALADQYAESSDAEIERLIETALARGITFFDTAPLYGPSEDRIGRALEGVDGITIATKVGLVDEGGQAVRRLSADETLRSVERSLARLRRDVLDLVQIHEFDCECSDEVLRGGGTLTVLRKLQSERVIRHIGVTGSDPTALRSAVMTSEFATVMIWRSWNLLDASASTLIPEAAARGVGVIIAGPYASGVLAVGARPDARFHYSQVPPAVLARVEAMETACRSRETTLGSAALAFCLRNDVSAVVAGAESDQQLLTTIRNMVDRPSQAVVDEILGVAGGCD
jgi:D-threo-aldose 1-dehydrogenase